MIIYLMTMPDGTFGSAGQSWKKLNLDKIRDKLDFPIKICNMADIKKIKFNDDDVMIYTSSENDIIRTYLKNNLFYLKDKIKLIPSYDLLMAHEDKGFQEVLKNKRSFGNLKGSYLFDIDIEDLEKPKVMKTSQGAGSSGVFLIRNQKDIANVRKKYFSKSLKNKFIQVQRKLKLTPEEYGIYSYRKKHFNLFVEQEFIPKLKYDFKVLVFGNRYFVLKRSIRKNDFRASGSGNFEFIEPPQEVLNFSREIASILDNPYLSLDVAQSDTGCHLIEFQGTNFGPYTLLNAPYRYVSQGDEWMKEESCKSLESNYAYALNYYLSNIND